MRVSTITAIGAFTALTPSSTDWLRLDPNRCAGYEDAPFRPSVEPASGQDGAIILPGVDDGQIITLGGDLIIRSNGDGGSGQMAAEDTLAAALKTALNAMKAAPGDFTSNEGTVKVWKYAGIEPSRNNGLKGVTFSVIVDLFA